jgi:Mlc titration factor MtfA (ptsG expression regulator)
VEIIAIILLLCVVIGMLIYLGQTIWTVLRLIRLVGNRLFRHQINRHFILRQIHPLHKKILNECFPYYHQLNFENKRLFEKRVQKFIDKKAFMPEDELSMVTSEMKVLIAACAVQLTFGLPGVYFEHFETIHVYPDTYFSEDMYQWNAGEVHKTGLIKLSWKDFLEGYLDPDNGRNTGLHEMAHALRLENMIQNEEYGYFDWDHIQLFNHYTVEESYKIHQGIETIFRPYAAVHYQEFFAVLIEVFFEQPKLLMAYHPQLFQVTTKLLRQNPMYPNLRVR